MHQIDVSTAASSPPTSTAPGTPGYFTDGDLLSGVAPTIVPAEFLNAIMLELLGVLAGAGIAPSKAQHNQLLLAIETLIESRSGSYALDTGVANAYVVALDPAITSYSGRNGLPVKFRAAHGNNAGCTLDAGGGAVPLLRDDATPLQAGDIAPNSIVAATYDQVAGAFLVNSVVLSQFGAAAKLGVGAFLKNDGSGNLTVKNGAFLVDDGNGNLSVPISLSLEADGSGKLRVKLADASLRSTSSGLQANEPVAYVNGAIAVALADHGKNFVSTAASTLTVPKVSSGWNGFTFSIAAPAGSVTVQPNPADTISNGAVGGAYLVPNGTSAAFRYDGVGNIAVLYQTTNPGSSPAPQYINSSQSLSSGQYDVDSSGGLPIVLTLPASPGVGTAIRLIDAFYSWGLSPITLTPGGVNTIAGNAGNFMLDAAGADILLIFKNGNWNIQ